MNLLPIDISKIGPASGIITAAISAVSDATAGVAAAATTAAAVSIIGDGEGVIDTARAELVLFPYYIRVVSTRQNNLGWDMIYLILGGAKMAWRWTCDTCGKQFKTSQGLFLHKRLAHQMTVEQARRNPLVQVWLCKICGFKTYYASRSVSE